jgi:hypothetical protein
MVMTDINLLKKLLDDRLSRANGNRSRNRRNTPGGASQDVESAIPNFADFIAIHPELQLNTCTCGREFSFAKFHCPTCGRAPLYPMARKITSVLPDGTEVLATKFRCRGCTRIYTDVEVYYNCKAKPPEESAASRKAREEVQKFTGGKGPTELLEELITLRKSQGVDTTDLEERLKKMLAKPGTPEWYAEHPEES